MHVPLLDFYRIKSRRKGILTFIGITVGAIAFGLWWHNVWAGIFIAAIELGIHFEAQGRK
jgi:hypothetical protein